LDGGMEFAVGEAGLDEVAGGELGGIAPLASKISE